MKAEKLMAVVMMAIVAAGLLTGCGAKSASGKSTTTNSDKTESAAGTEGVTEAKTESAAGTEGTTEAKTESAAETEGKTESAAEVESSSDEGGKTLVVYYSATGNTKDIAEKIANITEGDLFEIEPTEPYTDEDLDWTKSDSRVSREHDDESLRNVELVTTAVDNWDSYDTVYIGYPIWWGIAAWPVDNFVKANDFTGKTVIPFCTAASSGIGDSGKLLQEMAGTGDWKDGERFHGGASEADIRSWIEGLGL